jgi:hypothetical protein
MSQSHPGQWQPLRSKRRCTTQCRGGHIRGGGVVRAAMRMALPMVLSAVAVKGDIRAQTAEPTSGISAARWLAGCWELRRGETVTLEIWMLPEGGAMLGMSRTVQAGTLRDWEQLMLREDGDRLVYVAWPQGQGETGFTSTALTDSGFTVENLAHDFPQRIIYRRVGADSLVSRIEGPGTSGVRGLDFPMRRVACAQ